MWARRTVTAVAVVAVLGACATTDSVSPNGGPFPTSWVLYVNNDYFPLVTGTIYKYRDTTANGPVLDSVEVLREAHDVNGVATSQLHETVFINGAQTEETYEYYAQDTHGNVWLLGRDRKQYDNGAVVGTAGSFEWGVNGAQPGIAMWADPVAHIGDSYRMEYLAGTDEDQAKVVDVNQAVSVGAGQFNTCVKIEEWSGVSDAAHVNHYYCPQVGLVLAQSPSERLELMTLVQSPTLREASSRP